MSKSSLLWVTRDNREIPLSEMQDSHIRNTIAFLSRSDDWPKDNAAFWIERFREELRRRGHDDIYPERETFWDRLLAP